jgi:hypothetical protein
MDENHNETLSVIATLRSAAKKLTGFERRQFQAEVTNQYCGGSARRAEELLGWSRDAVRTGLGELRSGLRCVDAYAARGRKKSEDKSPRLAEDIRTLVEPTAQADPKFQTTLAYTRITAERVRDELLKLDPDRQDVPNRQTMGEVLNRMGYRLQRVLKTKPQKKCRKPTRSLSTSPPRGSVRRPIRLA